MCIRDRGRGGRCEAPSIPANQSCWPCLSWVCPELAPQSQWPAPILPCTSTHLSTVASWNRPRAILQTTWSRLRSRTQECTELRRARADSHHIPALRARYRCRPVSYTHLTLPTSDLV